MYIGNTPTNQSFVPGIDYFNGNGSTTAFTLSRPVYTAAQVQVFIDNVPQNPNTAFSVFGNTITFTSAPLSGTANIWVEYVSINTQTQVVIPASQFDVGTAILFQQTSAPTGWTKVVTNNDAALRVVSGTVGSGGSVGFTTAFASGLSAGATTLSTAQIPSHTHDYNGFAVAGAGGVSVGVTSGTATTTSTGGGGSHTHTLPSFAVKYVDVIIATKS